MASTGDRGGRAGEDPRVGLDDTGSGSAGRSPLSAGSTGWKKLTSARARGRCFRVLDDDDDDEGSGSREWTGLKGE